jgi:hypothetical protein
MRHLTLALGLLVITQVHLAAQFTNETAVFFESGQHALSSAALDQLESWLKEKQLDDLCTISLQAYTDARGAIEYNEELARKRAASVEAFLQERLPDNINLNIQVFGERSPFYSNRHEEGRQKNRRVDILLNCEGFLTLDALFRQLQAPLIQKFVIDPQQPNVLEGKKGTLFWIEHLSFRDNAGKTVEERVHLELQETYEYGAMASAQLSTMAGERLLETGGMICLKARTESGEELQLAPGKPIRLGMPTPAIKADMELFTAVTDEKGMVTDWIPEGQAAAQKLDVTLQLPKKPIRHYDFDNQKISFPPFDESSLPPAPVPPKKPAKPYKPHKPKREHIKYNPGGIKGILTSKEKIAQTEEKMYQREVERYHKALQEYEKQRKVFEQKIAGYPQKLQQYREEKRAWETDKNKRISVYRNMKDSLSKVYLAEQYERMDARHEEQMKLWRAACDKKVAEFEALYGQTRQLSRETFDRYFFQVNELGWINCDRFYDVPETEKRILAITAPDHQNAKVFIVFKNINSIISAQKQGGYYRSSPLPKNREATLVGVKVEKGRPYLAVKTITTGQQTPYALEFSQSSLSDIRKQFERLN